MKIKFNFAIISLIIGCFSISLFTGTYIFPQYARIIIPIIGIILGILSIIKIKKNKIV